MTITPTSPPVSSVATATGSGFGSYKKRLLLDGIFVCTICPATSFSQTFTVGSVVTSQTLSIEELVAGVWTSSGRPTVTFDVVDAPASSGPITTGTTIEDQTIQLTMPQAGPWVALETGIGRSGASAGSPLTSLTIRRCTIKGGQWGILLQFVDGFLIEDCVIEDVDRAGMAFFSCLNGIVRNNLIRRVGYVRTDFTTNPGLANNAYGIMVNRMESGSLVTDPVSNDIEIYGNTIDWVPLWMGINSHAGNLIDIHDNAISHCPRGIFVAGSPSPSTNATNISIDDNVILKSVSKSGGSSDQTGIKLLSATGTNSVTGNQIGDSYTSDDFDTTGSTGVTTTPANTVVAE